MSVKCHNQRARAALIERYDVLVDLAVEEMFAEMKSGAPRDTGAMTDTLNASPANSGFSIRRSVRAPQTYSTYQDEGTGIYGPQGTPIVPRNAKVLAFYWRRTGKMMFLPRVMGSPATKWWSDVIKKWPDFIRRAVGSL